MKRFIQTTLFFAVLASLAIYSNAISKFVIDTYNNSIDYLCSHSVKTSNPLGL